MTRENFKRFYLVTYMCLQTKEGFSSWFGSFTIYINMLTYIPALCVLHGYQEVYKIYSKLNHDQPVEATIKDCIIHLKLLTGREFYSASVDNSVIVLNGIA